MPQRRTYQHTMQSDGSKKEVVQNLSIEDFTYDLPVDKIAKYPLAERDSSKLLVYKNGNIIDTLYRNIADHIPANSLLIFNNTKVIRSRLFFENAQGSNIEIFCLDPAESIDPATAMQKTYTAKWNCLVGGAHKWKQGVLECKNEDVTLNARMLEKTGNIFLIEFSWYPGTLSFAEVIQMAGNMPIPPYLKRNSEAIDNERYQTIYSKIPGSVAAPTAGLHFTDETLQNIGKKNINTVQVTLHVGAGTFKPVTSATLSGHVMHAEWIEVHISVIETLLAFFNNRKNGKIIAVGTTALRTVETCYWMAVKAMRNKSATMHDLEVKQWDAYTLPDNADVEASLAYLLDVMRKMELTSLVLKTQLMIAPPYTLKIADGIVTNFHQPNSTLLLLVAAVAGNEWMLMYQHALANNYRFLSYGDGCLIL